MYEVVNNRKILCGENALIELIPNLKWYTVKKAFLVVYDSQADIVVRTIKLLEESGIGASIYDKVVSEPDLNVIDEGADCYIKNECQCVVAIGGGSVIDAAKAIAMLSSNGGKVVEYQMEGREVTKPCPLFITIPTTAGTGAEATKVSVIINNNNNWKKAIYHTSMIAEIVILDPSSCVGLPRKVTVATGMDAITHAIESYVSLNANPITEMYSLEALRLLIENIEKAYNHPEDLQAREMMLLGSYLAGCAIGAGTGLAHIVGQPLGVLYNIPHGDACSIFLVPSIKTNMFHSLYKYVTISRILGVNTEAMSDEMAVEEGMKKVEELATRIRAPKRLSEYISPEQVDLKLAIETIQDSMGHIKNNPRKVEPIVLKEMIQSAM